MPNYYYKCEDCESVYDIFLPMAWKPTLRYTCDQCEGLCKRIIRLPSGVTGFKVFAGDWFRKTYGFDIGERATTKAEFRRDLERAYQKDKRELDGGN